MATHFAILLTDQDTKQVGGEHYILATPIYEPQRNFGQVTDVHSNMRQWRDRVVNMAQRLQDMENAIAEKVCTWVCRCLCNVGVQVSV